jgi:tetratricopeptide (TPR) repeat protein
MMKKMLLLAVVIAGLNLISAADKSACEALYKQGMASWENRGSIDAAKKTVDFLDKATQIDPLNEKYWVDLAIAYYWVGEITPVSQKKERVEAYVKGEEAALRAVAVNKNSVGGNFWSVVNNGRVTELKGILSGSFNFGRCLRAMTIVSSKEPNYYYGGVFRYWGQFIYEMPSMLRSVAQFTLDDSIFFYKRSIEAEPNFFMTRLFLAESYLANKQRDRAKTELLYVVNTSPSVLPEVEPENRHYQQMARELMDKEFK